jgi:two-component system, LytTR family, sensor kinase
MVLVRRQSETEAMDMLRRLRGLLTRLFRDADAQEVSLDREIEYLRLYLAIEQVRFRDRLKVEISADPGLRDAAVPYMCLQPLVENAIRHGVARSSAAGTIRITAVRDAHVLRLSVEDNGAGVSASEDFSGPRRSGIGLNNTRARLQHLYGDAAALIVDHGPGWGTMATIDVPYRVYVDKSADTVMQSARTRVTLSPGT